MKTVSTRSYSRYSQEAATLLGKLIRVQRKQSRMSEQTLAERAGISRGLIRRIEQGDMKCEIGVVFEVATIVGIKLFDPEASSLSKHINQSEGQLALLPKTIQPPRKGVDDDF